MAGGRRDGKGGRWRKNREGKRVRELRRIERKRGILLARKGQLFVI